MSSREFAVVNSDEARIDPYPYVYVEDIGTYRELDTEDKKYLEEKFHPADGNRPYVKISFYSKTPDGKLSGFLKRSKLPKGLMSGEIAPPKPWWRLW
jgi:hypothetical protein